MEQLTKNQAVATSQEAVQNQNEPQLRDENAHNDKSVHGVLNPTYQAGLRRDAVQPDIEAERKKRVNIHITIIELNALHTKRQNLFQELDAVIHLLMEAKHWGLRKSRNATSLNSRFKSLDTLKVKIISVTFRRVIR